MRPWLYGIAAKQIGRQRREEVRALKLLARTGHDPVADSWTDSADDRLAAEAAARPLAGALAHLSAGDRHVLLLFAWADFSYQEIAEALGIPVGTVRSASTAPAASCAPQPARPAAPSPKLAYTKVTPHERALRNPRPARRRPLPDADRLAAPRAGSPRRSGRRPTADGQPFPGAG